MNVKVEDNFVINSGLRKLDRLTKYTDPIRFNSMKEHVRPLFEEIQAHKASDVFIQEGKPITCRVNGVLYAVTYKLLDGGEASWLLSEIAGQTATASINAKQAINKRFGLFDKDKDARNISGSRILNSYRVNVSGTMYLGADSFQICMRSIPSSPPHFSEVGLDEAFVKKLCPQSGIVLFSGVTGSGKTTTQASIIKYIMENNTDIKGNIITHEDPIEFTFENIMSSHSIIAQSQIPENFASFEDANREAMRRKPALIMLGELRDESTISSATEASLTGHPVFGTVHSNTIAEIIPRLLSRFPVEVRGSNLYDILSCASAFIAQRLVPKVDGRLMAVREHVIFSKKLKKELRDFDDHKEMNRFMSTLLDERGSFEPNALISKTFAEQGKKLLHEGVINDEGYRALMEFGEQSEVDFGDE
jgi:defect-in-organelle-trafficking protein DotB